MSTTANNSTLRALLNGIRDELMPFDGRWQMTWRVAAQCAIASLVFMTYGIPLAAIGCYLILFILRPDSAESSLMAIGITILLALVVGLLFILMRWSIEYPVLRMTVLVLGSFLFLFLAAASKLGLAGNILALVIGFVMTVLSDVPFGEVATRGLLYAWLMALTPMGVIIAFNLLLGRSTPKLVRDRLLQRVQAVKYVLQGQASVDSLGELLQQGDAEVAKSLSFMRLFYLGTKAQQTFLYRANPASYRLLLAVRAMPDDAPEALKQQLLMQCEQAERALLHLRADVLPQHSYNTGWADEAQGALLALVQAHEPDKSPAAKEGFMKPDAFSNPAYVYFALRTTAAAVICYLIYTALDWQDIHTAMVTCYVVALGSTAETVHKLLLRIAGCLIGAAMGIASIVFLMPYMTSILSLMLLVFVAILIAGWVTAGSERISYAGVQIGLAFLLTVLQGSGPTMEISAASDRVIGILLGNTVTFLAFSLWWPTSVMESVKGHMSAALMSLQGMMNQASQQSSPTVTQVAATMQQIDLAREGLRLSRFERSSMRMTEQELADLQALITQTEQACCLVPFEFSRRSPEYQQAAAKLPVWQKYLDPLSS